MQHTPLEEIGQRMASEERRRTCPDSSQSLWDKTAECAFDSVLIPDVY